MKRTTLLLALIIAAGCKAPTRQIRFESEPSGGRVFMLTGANEGIASGSGRNFLGTTPFVWTTEVNGDGTFKTERSGIPFYSDFVQPVVVFLCEPPTAATNLYAKREVFHGKTDWQSGSDAPAGVFFDLSKP